jgi:hypothetical protein
MEVSAGQSAWLIPPHFALWIPALTRHRIHMPKPVSMRTLYLRPGLALGLPSGCEVLHVTPLLRELIVETVRVGQLRVRNQRERALRDLLVSTLESASSVPTFVTLPKEQRALAVAQVVLKTPAESKPLAEMCAGVGVSASCSALLRTVRARPTDGSKTVAQLVMISANAMPHSASKKICDISKTMLRSVRMSVRA